MGYTAKQLVTEAASWVGYKEKKSNSQLDDFTANAGSGNWTCFARDLHQAGYYNGNKNGFAWCCCYVDYCHYAAAGKDKEEAQRVSCQTGKLGAVCTYSANYYKEQGRFDKNPKMGDQIYFFGSGSGYAHTGIVENVDDTYVYTIEGNASDMVCRKKYLRTNSKIAGYGHPRYDEPGTEKEPPAEETETTKEEQLVVPVAQVAKGSKGPLVLAVQGLLNGKASDFTILLLDGEFGTKTRKAVLNWQKTHGLQADGVVGPETWRSLIHD